MNLHTPIIGSSHHEYRDDALPRTSSLDLTLLFTLLASALIVGLAIVGGIDTIKVLLAWV